MRRSHDDAVKEEERRHRFLAEKHCAMIQAIANLMNKVYSLPQIAFAISIFYALWRLLATGTKWVGFVLQAIAMKVRLTVMGGQAEREFTVMHKAVCGIWKSAG